MLNDILLTVRIIYTGSKALHIDEFPGSVVGIVRKDMGLLRAPQPATDAIKVVGLGCVEFSWTVKEGGVLHHSLEKKFHPASRYAVAKTDPELVYDLSIDAIEYEKEKPPRRKPSTFRQSESKRSSNTYYPNKSWVRDKNTHSQSLSSGRNFQAEAEDLLEEVKREFEEPDLLFPPGGSWSSDYEGEKAKDSSKPVFVTKVEEESPSLSRFWSSSHHDSQRERISAQSNSVDNFDHHDPFIIDIPGLSASTRTSLRPPLTETGPAPITNGNSLAGGVSTINTDVDIDVRAEGGSGTDASTRDGHEFQRASSSMSIESIASSSGWKFPTPSPPPELKASVGEPEKTITNESTSDEMIVVQDMDVEMTPPVLDAPHSNSPPPFRPFVPPRAPPSKNTNVPPQPTLLPPPLPSQPPPTPPLRINTSFVPIISPNANSTIPTSTSSFNSSKPRSKVAFPFKTRAKPGSSQSQGQIRSSPAAAQGFRPASASASASVQSDSDAASNAGEREREREREKGAVGRLTQELEEVRKELREGIEKEQRILDELRSLGAGDEVVRLMAGVAGTGSGIVGTGSGDGNRSEKDDTSLYATKMRLQMVEKEIEDERRRRKDMEQVLKDIERECREPFIVPALLEAFMTVSQLTTKACQGI